LVGNENPYKSIFTTGLISGQLIYFALDSSCKPRRKMKMTNAETGELIIYKKWGWSGNLIEITSIEEIKYIKNKPTQRKFKFLVHEYNGYDVFLMELTNEKANKDTDMEIFIKDASVSFLARIYSVI